MNENNEEVKRHIMTFTEWFTRKDSPYFIAYGKDKRFITNKESFTIGELYEQYLIYCNKNNIWNIHQQ